MPPASLTKEENETEERPDTGEAEADVREEEISIEDWLLLPGGDELDLDAARRIMGAQDARLVVLAGEPDAGKTTLISCLYEKLSEGPFASLRFAGSNTILAFERTCHLSRTSSDAEQPDTERTKGLNPRFFHLILQDLSSNGSHQHVLLTDVSGEAYRRATNHTEEARKLSFIRRADRFVLLVDGKRVAAKADRQEAFRRSLLLLRSLTEAGMLDETHSVTIALSKFDLLQPGVVDKNTLEFNQYVKSQFLQFAGQRYKSISVVEIASRPSPGRGLPYAYGLDTLIRDWCKEEPTTVANPRSVAMGVPAAGREADLFLWRHFR